MDVMEHLIGLTSDRNLRTKLGAIEGLGELGSPRARPALERIVEGEILWSFKKRARRALRRIRDAEAERTPILEQQTALGSLDEERRELARRVADLETRADALRRPRR
jgi:HEAT repeat protein